MAFLKAFIIYSSLVGVATVKATVSASIIVVLMFGTSMVRAGQGSIVLGASGLSLILWLIAFCINSLISSSVLGRLFPFPLLVLLCLS